MSSVQPLPPKKDVALALLERSSVHVHLDPRVSSVIVPTWFKNQPQLVLQVGLNMPVPIPDLYLDEDGLSCTLSFNRAPFHCVVPWASVFAMVGDDGRGMVWPEDLPPEVARQAQVRAPQAGPALVPRPKEASDASRGLGDASIAAAGKRSADPATASPRARKKKGQLRDAGVADEAVDSKTAEGSKTAESGKSAAASKAAAGPKAAARSKPADVGSRDGGAKNAAAGANGGDAGAKAAEGEDAKGKKVRKKPRIVPNPEAENRARLVAVPAPAVSDPRPPRAEPRASSKPAHAGPTGAGRSSKGKRELPPYLRVVK